MADINKTIKISVDTNISQIQKAVTQLTNDLNKLNKYVAKPDPSKFETYINLIKKYGSIGSLRKQVEELNKFLDLLKKRTELDKNEKAFLHSKLNDLKKVRAEEEAINKIANDRLKQLMGVTKLTNLLNFNAKRKSILNSLGLEDNNSNKKLGGVLTRASKYQPNKNIVDNNKLLKNYDTVLETLKAAPQTEQVQKAISELNEKRKPIADKVAAEKKLKSEEYQVQGAIKRAEWYNDHHTTFSDDKANLDKEMASQKSKNRYRTFQTQGLFGLVKSGLFSQTAQKLSYNEKLIDKNESAIEDHQDRLKELNKLKGSDAYKNLSDQDKSVIEEEIKSREADIKERTESNESLTKENKRMQVAGGILKTVGSVASAINNSFKSMLGISFSIRDTFRDISKEITDVLDLYSGAATFSTGSSLISNSTARANQLKYGLTSAQNYGMMEAMNLLGIRSEEDLMYMNLGQQQLFSDVMKKYSAWYDEMRSSGVLQSVQELQIEFSLFKKEIAMDFLKWIAQNKDTIMSILKFLMNALKTIIDIIGTIIKIISLGMVDIGSSDSLVSTSDTTNANYNYGGSSSRNVSINMSNNATGILSSQEKLQEFFNDQMNQMIGEVENAMD